MAAEAARDFARARRRADLRGVLSLLGRREAELLSYDDVRRRLRAVESPARYLQDVPLSSIVGSVGRTADFTREFLPRIDAGRERWVGVKLAMTGLQGTPPVELYRIGDAYFVRDGNHRVSVARQLGSKTIQAYVTPVHARVPLAPDASPDDLIIAGEHSAFLERTNLDQLRPGVDLRVSIPGSYERLREHIRVHRYFMGLDQGRRIGRPEAVAHWYDAVYLPVVESIRASGLLRGFQGRTETDLYLWLSEHRGRLEEELGFALPPESIAEVVAATKAPPRAKDTAEEREALLEAVQRARRGEAEETLFADDVLVEVGSSPEAWSAVEQAVLVAAREKAQLYGLHLLSAGEAAERAASAAAADPAGQGGEPVVALRTRFEAACAAAGVPCQFAVDEGPAGSALLARARWVDLVVVPAAGGGYRPLLRRSSRLVLVVPGPASALTRGLVAFDGGQRSRTALFAAAYLAAKRDMPLVVLHVGERGRQSAAVLEQARGYLERYGLVADYLTVQGPVANTIVRVAEERDCDLLLMGGYRYPGWLEPVLGEVVEQALGLAEVPVLVC